VIAQGTLQVAMVLLGDAAARVGFPVIGPECDRLVKFRDGPGQVTLPEFLHPGVEVADGGFLCGQRRQA